jgi:uncharacterized repeat protein (TIGR03803 family)
LAIGSTKGGERTCDTASSRQRGAFGPVAAAGAVLVLAAALVMPAGGARGASEAVLYSFDGPLGGVGLQGPLIADAAGALYGTTQSGGNCRSGSDGCGTVFKLTPPALPGGCWTETILHRFTGGSDGAAPGAGLVADPQGDLSTAGALRAPQRLRGRRHAEGAALPTSLSKPPATSAPVARMAKSRGPGGVKSGPPSSWPLSSAGRLVWQRVLSRARRRTASGIGRPLAMPEIIEARCAGIGLSPRSHLPIVSL